MLIFFSLSIDLAWGGGEVGGRADEVKEGKDIKRKSKQGSPKEQGWGRESASRGVMWEGG